MSIFKTESLASLTGRDIIFAASQIVPLGSRTCQKGHRALRGTADALHPTGSAESERPREN
jgi:hypothetical protein